MRYFDPARPKSPNGIPFYLDKHNRPVAVIPPIYIEPISEDEGDSVNISLHLRMPSGGFAEHTAAISVNYLPMFWEEWTQDVEGTLKTYFGYEADMNAGRPKPKLVRPELTLDDLMKEE